jgi:AcrR family transcriptional regulator
MVMSEPDIRRRPGGRSARVREAVFEATLAALAEHGTAGFSIGDVAQRAGVHETSIYRRWGTRERLALDAMLDRSQRELPIPDTGSFRDDLAAFARELVAYLNTPLGRALTNTLAVADDEPTAVAARDEFWTTRFTLANVIVERAAERGEVAAGTDPRLALELLVAPLTFRLLATREALTSDLAEQLADLVAQAVRPPPPR